MKVLCSVEGSAVGEVRGEPPFSNSDSACLVRRSDARPPPGRLLRVIAQPCLYCDGAGGEGKLVEGRRAVAWSCAAAKGGSREIFLANWEAHLSLIAYDVLRMSPSRS